MAIEEIKSWMRFLGWSKDGGPGAEKIDADGKRVGQHGDAVWIKDVDHATAMIEQRRILDEIERRNRLRKELGMPANYG